MATFDEMLKRIESCGYPTAENEFIVTKQNPAPTLPFICYQRTERYTGDDYTVRIKTTDVVVEFYTDRQLSNADREKLEAFEAAVFPDTDYTKLPQLFIRDENMTQTVYQFQTVEKIRK